MHARQAAFGLAILLTLATFVCEGVRPLRRRGSGLRTRRFGCYSGNCGGYGGGYGGDYYGHFGHGFHDHYDHYDYDHFPHPGDHLPHAHVWHYDGYNPPHEHIIF
ncbi:unnamed protein product [Soboliphyme baturini]|uniref:Glycine rich protein n=1 Tax=Soboliphyme baturini TaxID=241478 RepID=A0A183IZB7_9BILA|nr:unnamed protein product [Soboliphyme baturini]